MIEETFEEKLNKLFEGVLNEGTWSHPFETGNADKFIEMFQKPITKYDSNMLYDICGDDVLLDNIEEMEGDCRPYIKDYVLEWLDNIKDFKQSTVNYDDVAKVRTFLQNWKP